MNTKLNFPTYRAKWSGPEAIYHDLQAPACIDENVLFSAGPSGSTGTGDNKRLPEEQTDDSTASIHSQPDQITGRTPDHAKKEAAPGETEQTEEQPGLQPKNSRYFKADADTDTGVGNA